MSLKAILEVLGVYLTHKLFGILPIRTASRLGGWMARKAGPYLPNTKTATRNLKQVWPEKSPEEIQTILNNMWDNLGRTCAEYAHLQTFTGKSPYLEIVGFEHLKALKQNGGPAILFAAHLANWELATIVMKDAGLKIDQVYRPANNPWVNSLIRKAQKTVNRALITKGSQGGKQMLSVLNKNGFLALLVDQKLHDGISVPFFGKPAMTAPAVARLSLRYNCPLIPVRVERLQEINFRVTIYPSLTITPTDDIHKDTHMLMTKVNQTLESWIRERPEQWLWVHSRWD